MKTSKPCTDCKYCEENKFSFDSDLKYTCMRPIKSNVTGGFIPKNNYCRCERMYWKLTVILMCEDFCSEAGRFFQPKEK